MSGDNGMTAVEDLLYRLFIGGIFAYDEVNRWAQWIGVPVGRRRLLMSRCVDAQCAEDVAA